MSGTGTPQLQPAELTHLRTTAADLRVAIVASRWHETVMDGLITGAERFLNQVSPAEVNIYRAPGSFELPVISAHAVEHHEAVIALGVVIRGGTPHFEYVCQAATDGLASLAVTSRTPIGFGLLTCDTEDQALARAGLAGSTEDKGFEAAHAAIAAAAEIARVTA
ncbi:6,7-dimethyl-8-ribityllumazine synthase [Nesterenkonia alba]|uniref:6,7-dimethyl-8-ribityllumazine synthase n=1 Tax=Nesterenkonia alba TaxID=515814 RepID=UPI0003B7194F|nr:6,7-dimethyl-8-ribityllumazine synthase [Nesterenkonia alba]